MQVTMGSNGIDSSRGSTGFSLELRADDAVLLWWKEFEITVYYKKGEVQCYESDTDVIQFQKKYNIEDRKGKI